MTLTTTPLTLDRDLRIADVEAVARGRRIALAPAARDRVAACRARLEATLALGGAHYGINTGFGSLSSTRIAPSDLLDLQRNLVRSHAAGVGAPLPTPTVRAMMVVLAASLARGRSGVRPAVVQHLCAVLNAGVTPVVPEVGSVGASGDLAPLAHVALALIGEGEVFDGSGARRPADGALRAAGLTPITLEAKEGLALINGTHLMAAEGALLVAELQRLFEWALRACAMSIDGGLATHAFLDDRVYAARAQPGPADVARRLRELLAGSTIAQSHRENDPRVQDPYSLRCAPIVLGACADLIEWARAAVERELLAVTDNPLLFDASDGSAGADVVSAGCFHGMPIALPLDALAMAVAHVAGVSERRVYHMISGFDAHAHLKPFLSPQPGLHSGCMIAQYVAAACCNELVQLASPASVVNISTSAGMEDYNSFGPRSAAKLRRGLHLVRRVVAVELFCAAQALEAHRPLRSGAGVEAAVAAVRAVVEPLTADRPPSPDLERLAEAIAT